MTELAEFLVELYVSREDSDAAARAAAAVKRAAVDLTAEGTPVRCLRFVFVPEDETCLLLVKAPGAEDLQRALDRAGLTPDRISPAASC